MVAVQTVLFKQPWLIWVNTPNESVNKRYHIYNVNQKDMHISTVYLDAYLEGYTS